MTSADSRTDATATSDLRAAGWTRDPLGEARARGLQLAKAGLERPFIPPRASASGGRAQEMRAEETCADIVQNAFRLFAEFGYQKTNITDIAQACGMSPGNLYRYFRNKQAIGLATVAAVLDEEARETAELLAAPIPGHEARLRAFVTLLVTRTLACLRASPRIIELGDMVTVSPEAVEMTAPHVRRRLCEISTIIKDGMAAGEFASADPERTARAFQLATRFFHIPQAMRHHGLDAIEGDLELTLDLICRGLRA